jgi:hypothetical protein
MPRKKTPKTCGCGCGEMTKGGKFIPGHDARLLHSILNQIGGDKDILELKRFVERTLGCAEIVA